MYFYKLTNFDPPDQSKGIYPFVTEVEKGFNFISTTVFGNTEIWRDNWRDYISSIDIGKKSEFKINEISDGTAYTLEFHESQFYQYLNNLKQEELASLRYCNERLEVTRQ